MREKRCITQVLIGNKDFEDLIQVYDKPDALFYLDPSYYGTEKYCQVQFSADDHKRLNNVLNEIEDKFVLSYNNCEFVRKLYKDYRIVEVSRNHNLKSRYSGGANDYKELIISNF